MMMMMMMICRLIATLKKIKKIICLLDQVISKALPLSAGPSLLQHALLNIQVSCHTWLNGLQLLAQLSPHSPLQLGAFGTRHQRRTFSNVAITHVLSMCLLTAQSRIDERPRAHFRRPAHDQLDHLENGIHHLAHQLGMAPARIDKIQRHIPQTARM